LARKRDEDPRGKHWKASIVLKLLLGVAHFVLLFLVLYVAYPHDLLFVDLPVLVSLDLLLLFPALAGLIVVTGGKVMVALMSNRLTGRGFKLRFVGMVLAGAGFIVSSVVFVVHGGETSSFYYSFFVPLTIGLVGLILLDVGEFLGLPGTREDQYVLPASVLDTFQKIGVDTHFSVEDFHVFVKGEIYILLEKKFITAYFVKLFEYKASPDKRIRLGSRRIPFRLPTPLTIKYKMPVFRSEGEFSIPIEISKSGKGVEEEKYAKGLGVLYWVSMYPVGPRGTYAFGHSFADRFDEPTILKIINDLSAEQPS
jgi:hypothetical protein